MFCGSSLFLVGTVDLDAHMMMTGDDTVGGVWTVAGGWEGLVCGSGSSRGAGTRSIIGDGLMELPRRMGPTGYAAQIRSVPYQ